MMNLCSLVFIPHQPEMPIFSSFLPLILQGEEESKIVKIMPLQGEWRCLAFIPYIKTELKHFLILQK